MPTTSKTICMGSVYWRVNARQRGSALPAASVLGPNRPARDAASAELRPCRGSASSARSTSSALSVCHAASGARVWRSAPGTSISLVCTVPPSRRAATETTRTPAVGQQPPAERRVRVAAPPILKEVGGIHPSILPLGPWPGQVPILAACDTHEVVRRRLLKARETTETAAEDA